MPSRLCLSLAFLLTTLAPLPALEPTTRGDQLRDAYFRKEVGRIAESSLAGFKTRADWERQRPELRRQFLDMLGLWPLPPRTDQANPASTAQVENTGVNQPQAGATPSPGGAAQIK